MPTLPQAIISMLAPFGMLFHAKTWTKVQVLLVGAILSPGERTVTSDLRVMWGANGLHNELLHALESDLRWVKH